MDWGGSYAAPALQIWKSADEGKIIIEGVGGCS